jgi:Mn-dependent DtxR family transcriptional regulator
MKLTRILEDEVLERLWYLREDGESEVRALADHLGTAFDRKLLTHMGEAGWVRLWEDGQRVELTAQGLPRARQLIRAHRLGERLIPDRFQAASHAAGDHDARSHNGSDKEYVDPEAYHELLAQC